MRRNLHHRAVHIPFDPAVENPAQPSSSTPVPSSTSSSPSPDQKPTSTSSSTTTTSSITTSSITSSTTSSAPPSSSQHSSTYVFPSDTFQYGPNTFTYNPYGTGSATPSASSTDTPAASSGGGFKIATVAGIGGGILGAAAVVFIIIFLLKRYWSRRDHEEAAGNFEPADPLNDDDASTGPLSRSISTAVNNRRNPRPPSMLERRFANDAPVAAGYANLGPGANANSIPYGAPQGGYDAYGYQQPSYAPGQYMGGGNNGYAQQGPYYGYPPSPATPNPSVPYNIDNMDDPSVNAAYLNHQVSPNSSYGGAGGAGAGVGRSLTGRRGSEESAGNHVYADEHEVGDGYYGSPDAGRGMSVTPFQAMQYAEISKRLVQPSDSNSTANSTGPNEAYARLTREAGLDNSSQGHGGSKTGHGGKAGSIRSVRSSRSGSPPPPARSATKAPMVPPLDFSTSGSLSSPSRKPAPSSDFSTGSNTGFNSGGYRNGNGVANGTVEAARSVNVRNVRKSEMGMHEGMETPVRVSYYDPHAHAVAGAHGGQGGRPDSMFDVEDAYGGI